MILESYTTKLGDGYEIIATTFNPLSIIAIHVILVYHSHSSKLQKKLYMLNKWIPNSLVFCPLVILDDVNVDMLEINDPHQSGASKLLQSFMN